MPRRRNITTKQIHADHWDNHEAVVIRSLNTDDEEHITDGLADINATGQPQVHAGRNKRLTLQRAIVSWTLTDEHGRPVPLSEDSIRELAQEDSQYIFEEIQALNKPLTDQEKKDVTKKPSSSTDTAESHHSPA
jgi:hypothetical protein